MTEQAGMAGQAGSTPQAHGQLGITLLIAAAGVTALAVFWVITRRRRAR